MVLALNIIFGIIAYGFAGGLTGNSMRHHFRSKCGSCDASSSCVDHFMFTGLSSIFWPIGLPAMCGVFLSSWAISRTSQTDRMTPRERRKIAQHKRNLEIIEAQKELSILEAKKYEAQTAFLESNGVSVRIPDFAEISTSQ